MQFTDEWLVPTLEPLLPDQAIAALRQEQAPAPASLWETVVQRRILGDEQVLAAIATRFRFPVADMARVDPQVAQSIPEQLARRFNVVPVGETDSYLEIATANPFDIDAEKVLAFATGREVRMLLASPSRLRAKVDELYRSGDEIVVAAARGDQRGSRRQGDRRRGRGGGERRGGEPAADHSAGGHDAGRRRHQPGERRARRADRGRRGGPLPHRRRAAPGHEDPAQRRAPPHLPHQDHVRARHRRPAAAAGRARAGVGERRGGGPARLDPARLARREGRHPYPEPARHRAEPRRPGHARGRAARGDAPVELQGRDSARHRADRLRQDDHAVLRHSVDSERGRQHRDGRGPGRIPAGREHRPGPGARQGRPHLRLGAAVDPATGSRRGPGGRDPRPGNRADRAPGIPHRSPGALHPPHQRRAQRGHPTGGHGDGGLQDRVGTARRGGPTAHAAGVSRVPRGGDRAAAAGARPVHPGGNDAVQGGGLPAVRPNRLPRPVQCRRGVDDELRDRAAYRPGRHRRPDRGRRPSQRNGIALRERTASCARRTLHVGRAAPGHRHPAGRRPGAQAGAPGSRASDGCSARGSRSAGRSGGEPAGSHGAGPGGRVRWRGCRAALGWRRTAPAFCWSRTRTSSAG